MMVAPFMQLCRLMLVAGAIATLTLTAVAEDPRKIDTPAASLDPALIYRFDPLLETFSPIAATAIKPDHIYHRFSPALDRWVWSKASAERRLEFAMGPGSVQPAFLFDLTATMEERRRVLEARAPDIARFYSIQGARAAVILGADGKWNLHGIQSLGHVYDLETGRRWEWHGDHRAEVVHGGGSVWEWHEGTYLPATLAGGLSADCRGGG